METMELLKKARKQAGMTQKEFSEYFGIPCRTIEDWERGARHMANYLLEVEGLVNGLLCEVPD